MIKKVFRPFWSYDVEKTEKWLEAMARDGYILTNMNSVTRQFTFEREMQKQCVYQIVFDKMRDQVLSSSLAEEGWKEAVSHRKWHIISNTKNEDQINVFPSREGVVKHNRFVMYFYSCLLIYLMFVILTPIIMFSFSLFNNIPITIVPSPYWTITAIVGMITVALAMIAIYSVIKINSINRTLIGEVDLVTMTNHVVPDRKGLIAKRRWYWFDAPDQLESWLEGMEKKGYHLQHISKRGFTFYFKKGIPRYMRYFVDFQFTSGKPYFDLHHEAGWTLQFHTTSSLLKWSIWSKEYKTDEKQPEIYSDQNNRLKHAKKIFLTNLLFSVPVLFLIYLMVSTDNSFFSQQMNLFKWTIFSIYMIGITVLLIRLIRSVLYYLRIRSNLQNG